MASAFVDSFSDAPMIFARCWKTSAVEENLMPLPASASEIPLQPVGPRSQA